MTMVHGSSQRNAHHDSTFMVHARSTNRRRRRRLPDKAHRRARATALKRLQSRLVVSVSSLLVLHFGGILPPQWEQPFPIPPQKARGVLIQVCNGIHPDRVWEARDFDDLPQSPSTCSNSTEIPSGSESESSTEEVWRRRERFFFRRRGSDRATGSGTQ